MLKRLQEAVRDGRKDKGEAGRSRRNYIKEESIENLKEGTEENAGGYGGRCTCG